MHRHLILANFYHIFASCISQRNLTSLIEVLKIIQQMCK